VNTKKENENQDLKLKIHKKKAKQTMKTGTNKQTKTKGYKRILLSFTSFQRVAASGKISVACWYIFRA